jgi:uncharacterized protein
MAMDWHDLLFMHWRVDPGQLRPYVPPSLEIEAFDGDAWLGIVPFVMSGTRGRLLPPVPGLSRFPELNIRTYVHPSSGPDRDKPGVWFFSLDATKRAAVEAARAVYSLPYFKAAMSVRREGGDSAASWVVYRHARLDGNERLAFGTARAPEARLVVRYRPVGPVAQASPGSLESFLTDRYRLYAWRGRLYAADIHHPPWPLQPGEAQIETNTAAAFLGLDDLSGPPLLHFSRFVKVAAWWPRRVRGA